MLFERWRERRRIRRMLSGLSIRKVGRGSYYNPMVPKGIRTLLPLFGR